MIPEKPSRAVKTIIADAVVDTGSQHLRVGDLPSGWCIVEDIQISSVLFPTRITSE